MTRSLTRHMGATAAVSGAIAFTFAACGGDDGGDSSVPDEVPRDAIAVVGDTPIPKDRYDRFLRARTRGISPLTAATAPTMPIDPPDYRGCIAAARRATREAAEQTPGRKLPDPSAAELKQNCESQYQQAQTSTVTQLIQFEWARQEGEASDVRVDERQVDQTYDQYVRAAGLTRSGRPLPPEQAQKRFEQRLEESGLTEEDVKVELRAQLVQQQLLQERTKDQGEPSTEEARKFYEGNREQFATGGGKPPPFEKVEADAKQRVKAQRIQRAQIQAQNELQNEWRPRTLCARGNVVPQCSNGPKPADLPLPG